MKLNKMYVKNFRGYYGEKEFDFEKDINVIIGKNDVGKSTILDALDIFFNDIKPDLDDLNKKAMLEANGIEISCEFKLDENDKKIIIDSTNAIELKDEFLLMENGNLKIKKIYDFNNGKISSTAKKYLCCFYPEEYSSNPLTTMKINALKRELEIKKESISEYENINKTISGEIRKALYKVAGKNFIETEIDVSKEDMKDISEKINRCIPLFFAFKSDRKNTDKDSEVQNPLQIATKAFLNDSTIKEKLDKIEQNVHEYIEIIAKETIEKFNEMNNELDINLKVSLDKKPWESIFGFSIIGDDEIPLNKRGSGIRRLILLSYFRAEAERVLKDKNSNSIIYAIEEPETAQHPDFQKMIIETLKQISENDKYQVIITTHTPEMIKLIELEKIILIEKTKENDININKGNITPKKVADTLGVLPYLLTKVIICVEGENDINFLRNIGNIPELSKIININEISIIPMVGSNLLKWIKENYLNKSNVKEVHIYDGDKKEYIDAVNRMNTTNNRQYGFNTEKLEMENYIPYKYIEEEFGISIEKSVIDNWEKEDVPKYLVGKVKKEIPEEKEREKVIKQILNAKVSRKITNEDLSENNAIEEIKNWFEKIKEFYDN